jgi:hypothetical protein
MLTTTQTGNQITNYSKTTKKKLSSTNLKKVLTDALECHSAVHKTVTPT